VVDFLLFHYQRWYYPAFNVADTAITLGAAAIIVDSFRDRGATSAAAPPQVKDR
jgi:signal peptidase II